MGGLKIRLALAQGFVLLSVMGLTFADDIPEILIIASTQEMISVYEEANYWGVLDPKKILEVPPMLVVATVREWREEARQMRVQVKKELFYRSLLPLVLYANEIIQGAPRIGGVLKGELREVVATLVEIINAWSDAGLIRAVNAHHLIFSIWATTQHYADFDVQVQAVLGKGDHFPDAEQYLEDMLRRILTV